MPRITFDHIVKLGNRFYRAGEPIEVRSPEKYLAKGARLIQEPEAPDAETEPKRKRAPRAKREA